MWGELTSVSLYVKFASACTGAVEFPPSSQRHEDDLYQD